MGNTGARAQLERPANTGLYYCDARYYDPLIGRFTQPDTIIPNPANPQDLNRYSYVRNNPATFSDPSGNEVCFIEGDRAGQCYEAADGEDTAQTREEEAATVRILSVETRDPDNKVVAPSNVRYSDRLANASGDDIVRAFRYAADSGLSGSARQQAFIDQVALDASGERSGLFGFVGEGVDALATVAKPVARCFGDPLTCGDNLQTLRLPVLVTSAGIGSPPG